jgi:CheY-like chemotaxis protein
MGRILIVEDHADTRMALSRLLRLDGHFVAEASSVAAAVEVINQSEPFDLLISEILLGDGTGWDVLRQAKEDHRPAAAIAVSGSGMENEIHHSLKSGFCMHLTKPVTFERLLKAVNDCMTQPQGDGSRVAGG